MNAIEFDHVGKQYRLGLVSTGTFTQDLNRWWTMNVRHKEDPNLKIGETNDRSKKGNSNYVWALKDINFNIEQGDVVGIIGKNGAGKSTLLKLLSRVTTPTVGEIRARGRIASLLEVGTGFHPEMTGRENIFMNGAIMGMTKQEIGRKLDEIIDFSGCERYIDTPVKRYSSGMTVRLGFAIAAHLEPEILVVDEVLAVGDAEFQKKAIGKMQDVSKGQGRTVLFVSHNMASVKSLCNSGIVLKDGMVEFQGVVGDAIEKYVKSSLESENEMSLLEMPRNFKGSGKIRFVDIKYLDREDKEITPRCGQYLKLRFFLQVEEPGFKDVYISIGILNYFGDTMTTFPSNVTIDNFELEPGLHTADCIIEKLPLTDGTYRIEMWVSVMGECADCLILSKGFTVEDDIFFKTGKQFAKAAKGKIVLVDHEWKIDK